MRSPFIILLFVSTFSFCQSRSRALNDSLNYIVADSLIKERLVALVMENPEIDEATAMVNSAEYTLKAAKNNWLNQVSIAGNLNEFVINGTKINGLPASTLFPKYNIGVSLPLGVFTRQEKNISRERIKMFTAQKESKINNLRKRVLILYEQYKEKKELYDLQKQITDGQYSTYQQTQRDYATGEINELKEVNTDYEKWIDQRIKQRSKELDLRVTELEIEELIGMKLVDALRTVAIKR